MGKEAGIGTIARGVSFSSRSFAPSRGMESAGRFSTRFSKGSIRSLEMPKNFSRTSATNRPAPIAPERKIPMITISGRKSENPVSNVKKSILDTPKMIVFPQSIQKTIDRSVPSTFSLKDTQVIAEANKKSTPEIKMISIGQKDHGKKALNDIFSETKPLSIPQIAVTGRERIDQAVNKNFQPDQWSVVAKAAVARKANGEKKLGITDTRVNIPIMKPMTEADIRSITSRVIDKTLGKNVQVDQWKVIANADQKVGREKQKTIPIDTVTQTQPVRSSSLLEEMKKTIDNRINTFQSGNWKIVAKAENIRKQIPDTIQILHIPKLKMPETANKTEQKGTKKIKREMGNSANSKKSERVNVNDPKQEDNTKPVVSQENKTAKIELTAVSQQMKDNPLVIVKPLPLRDTPAKTEGQSVIIRREKNALNQTAIKPIDRVQPIIESKGITKEKSLQKYQVREREQDIPTALFLPSLKTEGDRKNSEKEKIALQYDLASSQKAVKAYIAVGETPRNAQKKVAEILRLKYPHTAKELRENVKNEQSGKLPQLPVHPIDESSPIRYMHIGNNTQLPKIPPEYDQVPRRLELLPKLDEKENTKKAPTTLKPNTYIYYFPDKKEGDEEEEETEKKNKQKEQTATKNKTLQKEEVQIVGRVSKKEDEEDQDEEKDETNVKKQVIDPDFARDEAANAVRIRYALAAIQNAKQAKGAGEQISGKDIVDRMPSNPQPTAIKSDIIKELFDHEKAQDQSYNPYLEYIRKVEKIPESTAEQEAIITQGTKEITAVRVADPEEKLLPDDKASSFDVNRVLGGETGQIPFLKFLLRKIKKRKTSQKVNPEISFVQRPELVPVQPRIEGRRKLSPVA